jgi:hypothetical protein
MPGWLQLHWAALSWGIVSGILAYVFGFCAIVALTMATVGDGGRFISAWPSWPPFRFTRDGVPGLICHPWRNQDFKRRRHSPNHPLHLRAGAGANIAAMLGVHTTERELVELFHTTRDGTFPAQVLSGLKELGISGRKV